MRPVSLIHDAVTRAAERDPDHPAVTMKGEVWSYGELDRRSNAFAHHLHELGVEPGDRVGLHAHKSLEVYAALFGIMKAGAAYVPINPDSPSSYVQHIVSDCDIRALVAGPTTRRAALSAVREDGAVVGIGDDADARTIAWDEVWDRPDTPPAVRVGEDDLAYIIFTSGSTGRPKGIMHTHRSGLAYGLVAADTFGFAADDRIANHPPLNFDLSLLELWGGVAAGATIVVIPEAHTRLPASLSKLLDDERVTVLNAVPFALVQLLHRGALSERDLSSLRWVLFGGEVYPTKDLRGLMQRLPRARFANVYGPAEVNGVTYLIVPDLSHAGDEPISIGSLYPGMRAMVLGSDDRPVERGTTGEMLINSQTHMVGYWNQSELTAASTHHTVEKDGTTLRWHRTGDLVQEAPDGSFRLIGRKDRLVKVRGNRVELDEVETALISHERVEHAVVYTVPDQEGSQQIEAVVVLHASEDSPDETSLVAHAAQRLPKYAVPRVIHIDDSVPRTSTGKPDRVALRARASAAAGTSDEAGRTS